MADHGEVFRFHRLLHCCRVENITEDHRLTTEELKMGVHEFAERVVLPIIGESQLFYGLVPARCQNGAIGRSRFAGRMDWRGPYHKGDSDLCHIRRAYRCGLFIDVYAKSCHIGLPPYFTTTLITWSML